jgi:hypothetical protein
MKIEIDEQGAEELKFFIGMIIGKEIRGEDGCYMYCGGDEFTTFSLVLEDIYNQLDGVKDEDFKE